MKYADSLEEIEAIPTGLFVDRLTGVAGIPKGAITELFGDSGVGKSTLSLQLVANAQKSGCKCLWVDVEYSYTTKYGTDLGIDNKKLALLRSEFAEDLLDEVIESVDKFDLIVLDSIGALKTRAESEKGVGEKTIGGQAGLVAKFCRKVVPKLVIHNTALVVINHSFVDLMSGKIMTSGGAKLAYHKSLSIRLKNKLKDNVIKKGDQRIGKVVVGEVKKNKFAGTEGMECDGHLFFGQGFSAQADVLQDALDKKVITKEGSYFLFQGEKIAYGMPKLRDLLKDEGFAAKLHEALKTTS